MLMDELFKVAARVELGDRKAKEVSFFPIGYHRLVPSRFNKSITLLTAHDFLL